MMVLLFLTFAHAGVLSEPQLHVRLESEEAFLGEPLGFQAHIHLPPSDDQAQGWNFDLVPLPAHWGEARVVHSEWSKPVWHEAEGRFVLTLTAQLSWFQLGSQIVPELIIKGTDPTGQPLTLTSEPATVTIVPMLGEEDRQPSEAKPQLALPQTLPWWWVLPALLLAVLAFLAWRLHKKKLPEPVIPLLPPYEEALAALDALVQGPLLKEGQVKAFFVALHQVVRRYLGRLYAVAGEEMTTDEWHETLLDRQPSEEVLGHHHQLSSLADQVKFAKYDPVEAEIQQAITGAYELLRLLKPLTASDEEVTSVAHR
jgi:hypothetical protein